MNVVYNVSNVNFYRKNGPYPFAGHDATVPLGIFDIRVDLLDTYNMA